MDGRSHLNLNFACQRFKQQKTKCVDPTNAAGCDLCRSKNLTCRRQGELGTVISTLNGGSRLPNVSTCDDCKEQSLEYVDPMNSAGC